MGQQGWLEQHPRWWQHPAIGDRWPDTLATLERLLRPCVQWQAGLGYVRAPLGAANLYANATQRQKPSRGTLAAFAYAQRNSPGMGAVPRPLVSELPTGWGLGGKSSSRGSCTRVLGRPPLAAISLGLGWALRLRLRGITDSLSQHLAKLSLGLWRFACECFCPCSHRHYVGMLEGELNPR